MSEDTQFIAPRHIVAPETRSKTRLTAIAVCDRSTQITSRVTGRDRIGSTRS